MKKNGWIAIFILVFQLSALSLLMVATVCFAFTSGDLVIATAMIPLFMIAACLLAIHLARSFGRDELDKQVLRKVALVFMVLFLILFVAAVIYYYMARSFAAEEIPEESSVQEDVVFVEKEPVQEEVQPEPDPEPIVATADPATVPEAVQMFEVPTAPSVKATYDVPSKPSVFVTSSKPSKLAPAPATVTSWAYLYEPYVSQYAFDDDFWADFYVQGEDELVLEDGIYYMGLYVNGSYIGVITTLLDGMEPYLSGNELSAFLDGVLTETAYLRLFGTVSDYMALSYLEECGVDTDFDSEGFNVYLRFNVEDMPIQILSIKRNNRGTTYRPIAGSTTLEPARFVLGTNYTLSMNASVYPFGRIGDTYHASLSSYNSLRIGNVFGTIGYSIDYSKRNFRFNFGSYSFRADILDGDYSLYWGNISPSLLSPSGTSIGISFAKNYSYDEEKRTSHIEKVITVEKKSDVQVMNEGREIFRMTLEPGVYRVKDFILYTGANHIEIIITPLDGSDILRYEMDVDYSSSLLAPGEVYWNASLATGRLMVQDGDKEDGPILYIPWFGNRSIAYDPRNLAFSGSLNVGITSRLSLSTTLALKNTVMERSSFNPGTRFAVEMTHANSFGNTKYNLNLSHQVEEGAWGLPDIEARLGQQFYLNLGLINSISLSVGYNGLFSIPGTQLNTLSLSASTSGRIGIVGWGLSFYSSVPIEQYNSSRWNLSSSLSTALGRHVSLSASMNVGGDMMGVGKIYGSVYASVRFDHFNASSSWAGGRSTVSADISAGNHSIQTRVSTDALSDPRAYSLNADYYYNGDYLDFSAGISSYGLETYSGSAQLRFSSLFADGLFRFAPSIPSNFILISQKGQMRKNNLTIGSIGSSFASDVDTMFGIGLFSGLSRNKLESFTVYSVNESSFSGALDFNITIPDSDLYGYVLRLESESKYTYSGTVVLPDGSSWSNASSPLYAGSTDESGELSFEMTDMFLFTDDTGRFIVSDLSAGIYRFDVDHGDEWLSFVFTVTDDERLAEGIHMLGSSFIDEDFDDQVYAGQYTYENGTHMSTDEFWEFLYPMEEI